MQSSTPLLEVEFELDSLPWSLFSLQTRVQWTQNLLAVAAEL